jgi:FdhD protein
MSVIVRVEKIDVSSATREMIEEPVALEAPISIFVNDNYVITLLATPQYKKELALGWLFDEGVLESLDEIEQIIEQPDCVKVLIKHCMKKENLRVLGVSRLLTTACGLTSQEFYKIIDGLCNEVIVSDYSISAGTGIELVQQLDEGTLFRSTGGVHVAALFEDEELVAFAEDVGRHNTIDKVIGFGIQSNVNFSNSILVSSGRQPADIVLKAARIGIPIIISKAAPIRSGIIAAEKTGITLVCFARTHRMNVYTHHRRLITHNQSTCLDSI